MYPEGPEVPDVPSSFLLPPVPDAISPSIGNFALPHQISLIPVHTIPLDKDYYLDQSCDKFYREVGGGSNLKTPLFNEIN